ncbi:hypothetical protein [Halorarius halobius]|uniref:hypothetical protein n=1 Tax=Halorarius halobius TaxID=2962671 RepID=UPI0020CEC0C0|nr:hypothetical protein [Halorarius halobius]
MEGPTRRDVLRAGTGATALAIVGSTASAETSRPAGGEFTQESETRATVTYSSGREIVLEYDEAAIQEYQPQLVLQEVDPEPIAFHAVHASDSESSLNAVYGWTLYSHQEGVSSADSHLGDHEPVIVWYDETTGEVARVDYAAYHWFRGSARPDVLQYADRADRRPMLRVDPTYHHYYLYQGSWPGERLQTENLLSSMSGWLSNGLEESLAVSQPWDPWDMLGRETWWRHTRGNYVDALLKSLWFNLGLSGATSTADVEEVQVW